MDEKIKLLKTISDYIINLKDGIKKSADFLRGGEEKRGLDMVPQIAEGINWVIEALKATDDAVIKDIDINNLNEKLNDIVEALENQDVILIGDLFEYELISALDDVKKAVNKVVLN